MTTPSVLDKRARRLISAGVSLHWLRAKHKGPRRKDWQQQPTQSLRQLTEDYRRGSNVGLRPGKWSKIGKDYVHVLDVDIKDGREATVAEAYRALRKLVPGYKDLTTVASGSGGASRHFYFLCRQPLASKMLRTSGKKIRGEDGKKHWTWSIELFGTGKQVVIPPSIHPTTGRPYVWERFRLVNAEGRARPSSRVKLAQVEKWLGDLDEVLDEDAAPSDVAKGREDASGDSLQALAAARPMGISEGEIRAVLDALEGEQVEDYDGWLDMGFALHHEYGGSKEGFELWCEYASKSDKFDLADHRKRWKGFGRRRGRPRTFRSLVETAKKSGKLRQSCERRLRDVADHHEAVKIIAEHRLEGLELEISLARLKDTCALRGTKIGLPALKKAVRMEVQRLRDSARVILASDPETALARSVITHLYADGKHIKSVGGTVWVYEKGFWKTIKPGVLAKAALDHLDRIKANVRHVEEGSDLQGIVNESGRAGRMGEFLSSVERMVATLSQCDEPTQRKLLRLDRKKSSMMNVANGTLVFRKRDFRFRAHRPEDYFTYKVPFAWNPDARAPRWREMLAKIFSPLGKDQNAVGRFLEEILGYYLQTVRGVQIWTLFFGPRGANGKSQIATVLAGMLGEGGIAHVSFANKDHMRNNHFWASMVGKRVAMDDDFKKGGVLPDDIIKKLSEGVVRQANPKRKEVFDFWCEAAPLIISNHMPKTSDLSGGMERRAIVFPFKYQFPEDERVLNFGELLLREEGEGILRRLIMGWARFYSKGNPIPPRACEREKRRWMIERNSLTQFFADRVRKTKESKWIRTSHFWEAFDDWCRDNNVKNGWSRKTFEDELREHYPETEFRQKGDRRHEVRRLKLLDHAADT